MKRIQCLFGFHDWDLCVCRQCGTKKSISDNAHDWNGCKCRKCKSTNYQVERSKHDLDDKCKCRRCGAVRHIWEETSVTVEHEESVGTVSVDSRTVLYWTTTITRYCPDCKKREIETRESPKQEISH